MATEICSERFEKLDEIKVWNRSTLIYVEYKYVIKGIFVRNDHTTMTAPLPVCSAKLSIVGPG
jgi:hypothetical protein